MFCTFHTSISDLNRDKRTQYKALDKIYLVILYNSLGFHQVYTRVHVKEIQQEKNLDGFHSRRPNSHGFAVVSYEYKHWFTLPSAI